MKIKLFITISCIIYIIILNIIINRVGFFPGKKLFSPFRWKKLEISGKNWKKWKFMEKTMLSLLYLKMNVIKWYHSCNVGWKGKYFVHVNESMTLLITGLQFSSISMICFCAWPLCLDLQMIDPDGTYQSGVVWKGTWCVYRTQGGDTANHSLVLCTYMYMYTRPTSQWLDHTLSISVVIIHSCIFKEHWPQFTTGP